MYTKGAGSPSKYRKRFKKHVDPTHPKFSGNYHSEELLPANYDEQLLKEAKHENKRSQKGGDPFKSLGVGA